MARQRTSKVELKATLIEEVIFDRRAPHAVFFQQSAIDEFLPDAISEAKALNEFEADGCEPALWETLLGLGWSYKEISAVVANPAAPPRAGYGWPVAYRQ
jgi:uncharacterized protein YggL (DUF469 family)